MKRQRWAQASVSRAHPRLPASRAAHSRRRGRRGRTVSHWKAEKVLGQQTTFGGWNVPRGSQFGPRQGGQTMEGALRHAQGSRVFRSGDQDDAHRRLPRFWRSQARLRACVRAYVCLPTVLTTQTAQSARERWQAQEQQRIVAPNARHLPADAELSSDSNQRAGRFSVQPIGSDDDLT